MNREDIKFMSEELTYAKAGVDIDTTDAVKKKMAENIDVGTDNILELD